MSRWPVLLTSALVSVASVASGAAPRDRDRDGLPDRWERRHQLSTSKQSAKGDPDHDGLRNRREYRLRTNPRMRDTDRDGLGDRAEVRRHKTNPRRKDTDRDGFGDGTELRAGTNPRDPASRPPGGRAPTSPTPSGFPDASSTGVPAGTKLTAYGGSSTISTPGTVIDGKTMGCVRVTAPGVVIRNSRLSCAGSYVVLSGDGDYRGTRLLIEDSEIDCKNTGGHALGEANITARRVDIHGCENGGDINQNVTVEDSYIHDLYNGGSAHTDGFQLASGHVENGSLVKGARNVTFRHNTIYGIGADGSFGTSAIISNSGGDANILIENNLMAGGAYTLYCEQNATGVDYRVIDNHFSRRFGPKVGFYGVSTDCSDETQSGNVIHESGQSIRLG